MGAVQLVASLANGLIANLPRIIDAGVNLITGIVSASYSMMPQIIQNGMQVGRKLSSRTCTGNSAVDSGFTANKRVQS